ncbi:MAG: dihydropyrimidinase [bacterium]
MSDLVVANGIVVAGGQAEAADVVVSDGRIVDITDPGTGRGDEIVDAAGRIVLPGGVDAHVHFLIGFMGQRSVYDFYSGTVAALRGGVTTVIDFALQRRGRGLVEGLKHRRVQADRHVATDYGLHLIVTDVHPESCAEIPALSNLGVTSLKVYTTYAREQLKVEDGPLFDLMQAAGRHGTMVGLHAENDSIIEHETAKCLARGEVSPRGHALSRPLVSETEAVARALLLAEAAACPLHIFHLSSGHGLDHLAAARAKGQPVFAETCTHYLALTEACYDRPQAHLYVMSPPLRAHDQQERLWAGLQRGELAAVTSDDASYSAAAKQPGDGTFQSIANGVPGVEARLPLLYSLGVDQGWLDLPRLAEVFSTWPARLFGLAPEKGSIAIGADADLVIIDAETERVITAASHFGDIGYSPYEGMALKGWPVATVRRGQVSVTEGTFHGRAGDGRFLERRRPDLTV